MRLPDLATLVLRDFQPDRDHTEQHLWAVAATGLDLAAETRGADAELAVLFGLLHDVRSQPRAGHGERAAELARELWAPSDRLEVLCAALANHAAGLTSEDPTIGVCWDADRLHLPRLGVPVRNLYLSTAAARTPEAREQAARRREERVDWEALASFRTAARTLKGYKVVGHDYCSVWNQPPGRWPLRQEERMLAQELAERGVEIPRPVPPMHYPVGAEVVDDREYGFGIFAWDRIDHVMVTNGAWREQTDLRLVELEYDEADLLERKGGGSRTAGLLRLRRCRVVRELPLP